jgi:sporulation integral membrane protein YlbJ
LFLFLAALAGFAVLLLRAEEAREGAFSGLLLCARVIIPSLFPFFVAAGFISRLGFPEYLGRIAAPFMSRLFGVSGEGAAAFVLGLTGGYPLGAATVADLYREKKIKKEEAEHLLAFCNNSGPAFIVGAAGVGVFGSAATGLLLYLTHILAAAGVGVLTSPAKRGGPRDRSRPRIQLKTSSLPKAFADGVRSGVTALLTISGFVVFFSAIVSVLDGLGVFGTLAGSLAVRTGAELSWTRALLTGLMEIGGGIGALEGLSASPVNLALAAFLLGWGGLSVQCQALGVLGGTELSAHLHLAGKLLHGLLSAALSYTAALLLF